MKLIVNADDFGRSSQINSDIIKCHEHGIVTSTTIMAGGEKFEEAIELAKLNPKLGIGVHLALDGEFNVGDNYTSLIDPITNTFYKHNVVLKNISKFKKDEIVKEYSLQIEKVLDNGVKVTHLDHHHHLHLYFPILNAVIKTAKKYHINCIRSQKILCSNGLPLLNQAYRMMHQTYVKFRLNTTSGYSGFNSTEKEQMFKQFNQMLNAKNKTIDLMVHPSLENGELLFLTDKRIIESCNNKLFNYSDLK